MLYTIFTFLHKEPLLENMFQMLCSQCVHSIHLYTICTYLVLIAHCHGHKKLQEHKLSQEHNKKKKSEEMQASI